MKYWLVDTWKLVLLFVTKLSDNIAMRNDNFSRTFSKMQSVQWTEDIDNFIADFYEGNLWWCSNFFVWFVSDHLAISSQHSVCAHHTESWIFVYASHWFGSDYGDYASISHRHFVSQIQEVYGEAGVCGFWKGVFPTLIMVCDNWL